jgi:hypothetical protein
MELHEMRDALGRMAFAADILGCFPRRSKTQFSNRLHKNKALYFAACGDAVKVGASSEPRCRIENFQTGAPGKLVLLAVIPRAGHRESECHRRLAHLHIHGEWFQRGCDVDALIKELQALSK